MYGYNVAGMYRAHMNLTIRESDYDAFMAHVGAAAKDAGVSAPDVDAIVGEFARFKEPVLGQGVWND